MEANIKDFTDKWGYFPLNTIDDQLSDQLLVKEMPSTYKLLKQCVD